MGQDDDFSFLHINPEDNKPLEVKIKQNPLTKNNTKKKVMILLR